MRLAERAARTGEPILRPLAYDYPDDGYDTIVDQFMLGPDLLVAPVVDQGAVRRTVVLPSGRWRAEDGSEYDGPDEVLIDAPLSRLPRFERLE